MNARIRKTSVLFSLGLAFIFQGANASSVDLLDRYYQALTKMGKFSGSVMYFQNGKLRFSKYYGKFDLKKDFPSHGDSNFSFRIGSLSKPITAVAVLSLVEEKKLTLDTPVNQIIPNLEIPSAVTPRNLLNHTSGAIYEFDKEVKTEDDFRAALTKMHWEKPGKYVYSNTGYQLLGLVLKKITGESLPVYERTKLFSNSKVYFSDERSVVLSAQPPHKTG